MEESRAISGAQRPLHRQSLRSHPPQPRCARTRALFAGRPLIYVKVLSSANPAQIASTSHRFLHAANYALIDDIGKTIYTGKGILIAAGSVLAILSGLVVLILDKIWNAIVPLLQTKPHP